MDNRSTNMNYFIYPFLSAIGEEALESYEGLTFNPPESSKEFDSVVHKFEEYCIELQIRSQKEDESIA